MSWNPEKIRILRRRMGWSQSDLARRLNCESHLVHGWENGANVDSSIQIHADTLLLLEKQAEVESNQVQQSALAETMFDELRASQVDANFVKRRFFENN